MKRRHTAALRPPVLPHTLYLEHYHYLSSFPYPQRLQNHPKSEAIINKEKNDTSTLVLILFTQPPTVIFDRTLQLRFDDTTTRPTTSAAGSLWRDIKPRSPIKAPGHLHSLEMNISSGLARRSWDEFAKTQFGQLLKNPFKHDVRCLPLPLVASWSQH